MSAPNSPNREALRSGMRGVLDGLTIVIVDDDPDARDLLATVLTQRHANVLTADCAADALDLLAREQPDILISDIAMPEEDGYMLIKRVRALPLDRGARTPAIAVTAYAGRLDHQRAIEAGFDAHLAKPIDIDALLELLIDIRLERDAPAAEG